MLAVDKSEIREAELVKTEFRRRKDKGRAIRLERGCAIGGKRL